MSNLQLRPFPSSTHWIGGCVGTIAFLDAVEKENVILPGVEPQFLGRLTRSLVSTGITE
jgi:hypothetical protein